MFIIGDNTSRGNKLSHLTLDLAGLKTKDNGFLIVNVFLFQFLHVLLSNGLFQKGADGISFIRL